MDYTITIKLDKDGVRYRCGKKLAKEMGYL